MKIKKLRDNFYGTSIFEKLPINKYIQNNKTKKKKKTKK